jgi:hypothetical protein
VALRLVVALRSLTPELERALRAKKSAEALGGSLCAWGAADLAFAFDADEIDGVVAFARGCAAASGGGFAVGIARGDLSAVDGASAQAELSWGPALLDASAIAAGAEAGSLWVEDEAAADFEGRVGEPVAFASPMGRPLAARPLSPGSLVSAPPSVRRSTGLSDLPPSPEARAAADLAVEAIRSGDLATLERHLEDLRVRGASSALIARLSGLAALGRGATSEALRTLRAAAESATEPASRIRANLAVAVALGAAGRNDDALLAALRALGASRAAADRYGERACARYLAQLSAAAGFPEASVAWDRAALRAVGSQVDP